MERGTGRMNSKKQSLQQKLAMVFAVIIVCIMLIMLLLYTRTVNVIRQETYEKMHSQAEYYQNIFDMEIQGELDLQLEFFNNRKLPFLASPVIGLEPYEEREALLNVQERIRTITEASSFTKSGVLYIPGTNYYVSSSTVRRMSDADWEDMDRYLENRDISLQFDGEDFYSVRTGETGNLITENPNYVFVLFFSGSRIEENLALLNASSKGGAFIYNEKEDVVLESASVDCTGRQILEYLERNDSGSYKSVQRLKVEGRAYLVFVGKEGTMGVFVQYAEEASLMKDIRQFLYYYMVFLAIMIGMSVAFILYTRSVVHRPLNTLVQAFERLKEGNLKEHIYHGKKDEFSYLYQAFNDMEDRLENLIDQVYVQKNLAQRAELKQLQTQINPHFLYNSFFILSRRIKRQDFEKAEALAMHLSDYFKYLTRNGADFIPLRKEMEHAGSYAAIQQDRFSSRLQIIFEALPEAYGELPVPRLIVQPLLENSFEHGLENKESGGILKVGYQAEADRLLICVEDNGEAADEDVVRRMRESLEAEDLNEITGLVNIHRRLKIFFHGNGGLLIDRSASGGISITISIPVAGERGEQGGA